MNNSLFFLCTIVSQIIDVFFMLKQFYNKGSKDEFYVVKVWIWVWFIYLIFFFSKSIYIIKKIQLCQYLYICILSSNTNTCYLLFSSLAVFFPYAWLINRILYIYTCVLVSFLFYILSVILVCAHAYTHISGFFPTVMINMLFLGDS